MARCQQKIDVDVVLQAYRAVTDAGKDSSVLDDARV
jgi:hypothetical protein